MISFPLTTETIALCDLLKITNLCGSGGEAKLVISEGLVTVDGKVETRKRCKIRSGQLVTYRGEDIRVQ